MHIRRTFVRAAPILQVLSQLQTLFEKNTRRRSLDYRTASFGYKSWAPALERLNDGHSTAQASCCLLVPRQAFSVSILFSAAYWHCSSPSLSHQTFRTTVACSCTANEVFRAVINRNVVCLMHLCLLACQQSHKNRSEERSQTEDERIAEPHSTRAWVVKGF